MSKQKEASQLLREFISPAFGALKIPIHSAQLDEMTDLVGSSMVGAGRFFHNPEHVIHVGSEGDAISVIAAFFHDLVYFQVDQGVGLNVARHIAPFVVEKGGDLFLRTDVKFEEFPFASVVMGVFGYSAGEKLPAVGGQNEFLSALTAGSVLAPFTNLAQIFQVAACIEATIPFRMPSTSGESAADRLYHKLMKTNAAHQLAFTDLQLKSMVRRAVKMANQDVSNFGGDSATRFLKNTWELVPEINPMLRSPSGYSIEGYRDALQKMERFFSGLDASRVFQKFDGEPAEAAYDKLCENAASHIEEARYYFRFKLMSLALLEALAGTLGKNLGLPVLMGELSNLGSPEDRVDKFLPPVKNEIKKAEGDEMEARVLKLLEKNAEQEAEVGLKSSPLTAFLLRSVGFKELVKAWTVTTQFFDGKVSAPELLQAFPMEPVGYISDAVSLLLQRRAQRITTFVGSL